MCQVRAMSTQTPDVDQLSQWIGRTETLTDRIDLGKAHALSATLDLPSSPVEGGALPPLWHWMYFWSVSPASLVGRDGHPQRGGFLPPVTLPRRMWAGSRVIFRGALPVGAMAERTSLIKSVNVKQGKSGPLVFVTVAHEVAVNGEPVILEEHDIVYRDPPQAGDAPAIPKAAPTNAQWSQQIVPDPVLLFRYSALTFNGHRIHYDRSYVTEVEGYPGLIVHGPLIATLLIGLAARELPGREISSFAFRAVSPLVDIEPFSVHGRLEEDGRSVTLWAANARGELAMQAEASLA
jgi:3-methylfumaryl-CoA hydratase